MFYTMSLVLTLPNQFYFNASCSMGASWDIFSYPYDDKQPFGSCAKKEKIRKMEDGCKIMG